MPEFKSASLDFVSKKIFVELNSADYAAEAGKQVSNLVHHYEPDVLVTNLSETSIESPVNEEDSPRFEPQILRLITALGLFASSFIFKMSETSLMITILLSYIIAGYPVIIKAFKGVKNGQLFDENFLMTVATFGALGLQEWREAAAVMLFYEVGEAFQDRAVNNSRKSIKSLLNIKPDSATLLNGLETKVVSPEKVLVGQKILIKPGEKVPLDGIVLTGQSTLDTSALTGEAFHALSKKGMMY